MVYIFSVDSISAIVEYFESLEEIDSFLWDYANEEYSHLICGDFSSHTGTMLNYVMNEDGDDNDDDDNSNGDLCEVHHILSELGMDWVRYNQETL